MLVLTRRRGEAIVIGDDIIVRVLEISGDQIRLGIDAPRSVTVHRQEIFEEIQAENRAATAPQASPPSPGDPSKVVAPASLPSRPPRSARPPVPPGPARPSKG